MKSCDMQLEPLFTIRASKQTSGFAYFRSQNYQIFQLLFVIFNFSCWVYGPLKEYSNSSYTFDRPERIRDRAKMNFGRSS